MTLGELHSTGELAGEFDTETAQLAGRVKDKTIIRAKSLDVKLASADGKMQLVFGQGGEKASVPPLKRR
jgi:hypothetical protein